VIAVEIENRSGEPVDEDAVAGLCRAALTAEAIDEGDVGVTFVAPDEMRTLKREHLGVDEATDVLSFPDRRALRAPRRRAAPARRRRHLPAGRQR
jgi:ssRNA-specific RNase YbeY (16S rRNA maturation enzyme)